MSATSFSANGLSVESQRRGDGIIVVAGLRCHGSLHGLVADMELRLGRTSTRRDVR